MIDVFNLKVGDKLVYNIPLTDDPEKNKRIIMEFNSHTIEVIDIIHPLEASSTVEPLIIVRDEPSGCEYITNPVMHQYLYK